MNENRWSGSKVSETRIFLKISGDPDPDFIQNALYFKLFINILILKKKKMTFFLFPFLSPKKKKKKKKLLRGQKYYGAKSQIPKHMMIPGIQDFTNQTAP